MDKLKRQLRKWLGIEENEHRINTLEDLFLHKESKDLGFAVPKVHLQAPEDKYMFGGKRMKT